VRRGVFVDTSAWYALADLDESHHTQAERTLRHLRTTQRMLLTTNHVLSETYTLLRIRIGSGAAREFLRRARLSSVSQRVFVSESWEEAAEDLLLQYGDQDFSYVDATSFIAMRRLGLEQVFCFDRHFATVGFTPVREDD
jgi:uncharacterized protein